MNCVFIGDEFYSKSRSIMSPIYKIESDGFSRTDWGKVHVALRSGISVHIRPATEQELVFFAQKLENLEKELADDHV